VVIRGANDWYQCLLDEVWVRVMKWI
jgi:hypothetical protein